MGLIFLWPTSWLPLFPAILFCYSCCNDSILLGLPFTLSSSSLVWPLVFLLICSCVLFVFLLGILGPLAFFEHPWPICFLWTSMALLLTQHSHGLLLTSLGFPGLITLFSSLGFMGLLLTSYFLCLHYFRPAAALFHFFTSYTTHRYAISLFSGFFKPTCLFKAHSFISWTCDPLFLLLGPNGFAIYLPIFCCPCHWAFLLSTWILTNDPQQ